MKVEKQYKSDAFEAIHEMMEDLHEIDAMHLCSATLQLATLQLCPTFHHKVLIIDDQIVVTGSFNFSKNANTRNDENAIVIHSPAVAQQYLAEFDRRWGEAKRPNVDCP